MSVEANNMVYWLLNPLGASEARVLRRVARGSITNASQTTRCRFDVAHLIARECLLYDEPTGRIAITEKGLDALEHDQTEE